MDLSNTLYKDTYPFAALSELQYELFQLHTRGFQAGHLEKGVPLLAGRGGGRIAGRCHHTPPTPQGCHTCRRSRSSSPSANTPHHSIVTTWQPLLNINHLQADRPRKPPKTAAEVLAINSVV